MNRKLAFGLLVLANVFWGSSYVAAKLALRDLPPPLLGALRVTLASALIWLAALPAWRAHGWGGVARRVAAVPRRDALRLAGLGAGGLAVDYLLAYQGISRTSATDASLMIIGEVIFTTLLAVALLGERLSRRKLAGIGAGAAGVAALVFGGGAAEAGSGARAIGDALILCGLLAAALYSVLGAGMARKYAPIAIMAYAHAGSMLVWAPVLAWYALRGFPAVHWPAAASVVYLGLVTSLLCYLLWFAAAPVVGADRGAVTLFVQPLVGALLGLLLLHEPLTLARAVGAALIFLALYLTSVPGRRPRRAGARAVNDAPGAL